MNDTGHLERVFERAFSAQDLARPLISFDAATPAKDARSVLEKNREEIAGVRTEGVVTAFVELGTLSATPSDSGSCGAVARSIEDAQRVVDSTSLADLVLALRQREPLFVVSLGQVGGVVRRFDFNQAPARMWLFGMVTLLEMRFSRMIQGLEEGRWKEHLSEGRLQKADAVRAERATRNPRVTLVECLQWADKIEILAQSDELRGLTRFESKRQIRDIGKHLERLRNNLAHSQDVVADGWETIVALAENLERVLKGPAALEG